MFVAGNFIVVRYIAISLRVVYSTSHIYDSDCTVVAKATVIRQRPLKCQLMRPLIRLAVAPAAGLRRTHEGEAR